MEFFRCPHCGNLVLMMHASGVPMICCGTEMVRLSENTSDGATEKHVPVVTREGNKVHIAIGSAAHPMIEAHYIQWVALETSNGVQIKYLKPDEAPAADFEVAATDTLIKAYEYCNLHGLWSAAL